MNIAAEPQAIPRPPERRSILWEAQPGSQQLFLSCPVPEILYEGTRGASKTDALLMKFAMYVGRGYASWWRGILFRQTYKQLDEIVVKTRRWFGAAFPNARLLGGDQMKWVWPSGEELLLRHFAGPGDYQNYHGHEYPFIAWEELTTWPTMQGYEMMKACWRSSCPDPTMPRFYCSTTNPMGAGHNWVKTYFVDPAEPGKIIRDQDERGRARQPRVRIHGSIYENKALMRNDPKYVEELEGLSDPVLRAAWLFGSWDITSGGMFDDVWTQRVVLPPFVIPDGWHIERAFDWGSSKPFSVGWWAKANGEDARMPNGELRPFNRGSLIRIAEWYGWNGKANEGSRMLSSDIARGIREREQLMGIAGRVFPGPADTNIFTVEDGKSIADNMALLGVRWEMAQKTPGSRKLGWEKMREMFGAASNPESDLAGLYTFDTCRHFIRTVKPLARSKKDPDDVDTETEDHCADEARYEVLHQARLVGQFDMWSMGSR